MTRKIDFTTEFGGLGAERFRAALHLQALDAGDQPDDQRHERRLDDADFEGLERDGIAQARHEHRRADAAVKPGHQAAAVKRRHRAEEGQQWHRDHEREDTRQDEHLDRIEAHGAQGIHFLAHLHGAELGGIGAAGTSGHHDANDHHAKLTQHQHANHVDDVDVGAEAAEMEDALLRDDRADQQRDHQNDRHGVPRHALEMLDHGGEAEGLRPHQHVQQRQGHRAAHLEQQQHVGADQGHGAADAFQGRHDAVFAARQRRQFVRAGLHLLEQAAVTVGQPD